MTEEDSLMLLDFEEDVFADEEAEARKEEKPSEVRDEEIARKLNILKSLEPRQISRRSLEMIEDIEQSAMMADLQNANGQQLLLLAEQLRINRETMEATIKRTEERDKHLPIRDYLLAEAVKLAGSLGKTCPRTSECFKSFKIEYFSRVNLLKQQIRNALPFRRKPQGPAGGGSSTTSSVF
ncbi:hypothetical protein QR680_006107 [Steinernema hermaphroditum]|uniref:Uncharacterized protein n=1 Tax=Steinernema hermaphroditum TaxID=289476 RepID=A0AA39HUB4_9BILA|nr:hypothetical protein QR680_006107 [Steinernema hermaphroditum]